MKIKARFDAWVQGMVDKAVDRLLPCTSAVEDAVCEKLDYRKLAGSVATNDDLTRAVVEQLEDSIDTGRIAEQVAETISAEDVAYHMDAEDVAGHVDVDSDEIAEKVAGEIDVSSCIDYDTLAEKLVEKLKEAWA
jgi:hypothetical protein